MTRVKIFDIIVILLTLLVWVCLFGTGTLVDSGAHLGKSDLKSLSLVLVTSTPTNICIVTILAAILGGYYKPGQEVDHVLSIVQGFSVFLILSSGLFLLGDHPYIEASQQKYVSLASLSSFLGFLAASDPSVLSSLIKKITSKTLFDGRDQKP